MKNTLSVIALLAALASMGLLSGCMSSRPVNVQPAQAVAQTTPKVSLPMAKGATPQDTPKSLWAQQAEVELKTEAMSVSKETVSNGEAVIAKVVTSQNVTQETPLNVEDVVIEHVQPGNALPATPFGEVVATVPLNREQAAGVVTPRVKEIVRIRKTTNVINTNVVGVVRDETATIQNKKIQ